MSEINTIDRLGDETAFAKLTDGTITEFVDNVLKTIGVRAFYNCAALTSVSFPEATTIDGSAFRSCTALTSVSLPKATSIGSSAFQSCEALTTLVLENTSGVVTLSSTNAFSSANNCIIYVPDALVDSYKAASNWSTYASRIKGISELPT